jgi:regulator of sigma E protease
MLNSLFSFLLAIGILVFLHEFGHYAIARHFGVRVIRFSVGFGKPIFKWVNPKTQVEWTIGWIPLGGYVRMLDERDPESVELAGGSTVGAFNQKPVWHRIAIVAAGPIANLLVAVLLYSVLALTQESQLATTLTTPSAKSAAAELGIQNGDRVIAVNNVDTADWSGFTWEVLSARLFREDLNLSIDQGGTVRSVKLDAERLNSLEFAPDLPAQLGFRPFEGEVKVRQVIEGSAAKKAGLVAGDVLKQVDGVQVMNSGHFTEVIRNSAGKIVTIQIIRNGVPLQLEVMPDLVKSPSGESQGKIGVALAGDLTIEKVEPTFLGSIATGVDKTIEISVFSLAAMGSMLTGDLSWKNLSGPVTIASAAGESSSLGILPFLGFLAMVSVSLGILNLLPIPVLDGGHLMYYFAELIRGKPLSEAWQQMGQRLGLVLVGLMTCLAFFNDLQRLL